MSANETDYWRDPIQEAKTSEDNRSTFPIVQKLLTQYGLNKKLRIIQPDEITSSLGRCNSQ